VARGELTNEEWAVPEPLLPAQPVQDRRWRDHRQVINAICWVKRTGSPWRDLPERDKHLTTTIPQPTDQIAHRPRKGRNGGRPPAFDPAAYKRRNQVERGSNRRKHRHGSAPRYDKLRAPPNQPSTSPKCSTGSGPYPTALI
jgi:transposase